MLKVVNLSQASLWYPSFAMVPASCRFSKFLLFSSYIGYKYTIILKMFDCDGWSSFDKLCWYLSNLLIPLSILAFCPRNTCLSKRGIQILQYGLAFTISCFIIQLLPMMRNCTYIGNSCFCCLSNVP